jgi:Delta3-Delta2-enoyl-CoA isomerase
MGYQYLGVERKGDVFIITLRKPPENRLNVTCCQELIGAYHSIQKELGPDAEGAVVLTGSDAKFFTTVSSPALWQSPVAFLTLYQGLDLDEREGNIFSSSDGFYPVSGRMRIA